MALHINNKQKGLSLVELMVALVISLFLSAGLFSMFSMSSSNVTTTSQFNQLQENGRIALAIMERDISQVSFFADLTGTDFVRDTNTTVAPSLGGSDCEGSGLNNQTLPNTEPSHFRRLWGYEHDKNGPVIGLGEKSTNLTCLSNADDVAEKTDVIQIKRLIGPDIAASSRDSNRVYVVTNSSQAIFFSGASSAPSLTSGRYWEYQHHVYYIRNDGDIPVLRRRYLSVDNWMKNEEQLVEGIENIRVLFGFDDDGDNSPDGYVPAKDVSTKNWDNESFQRLVSVKLFILVRSLEKDLSYTNDVKYIFGDKQLGPYNDNYRRKVMSTTIVLENPALIRG
ncbi:PilW family protein [Shewanella alkalitolerans]|uniref:PilW family protein n=1 Tax=Shewanella alkalitolerans TaxID=2864209 RepID=UPI001C65A2F4|nr:PilW family protein [Shewanella alkalitolerans]QYJ98700.1 PilW family protein [Shewanella alkalitolerans]